MVGGFPPHQQRYQEGRRPWRPTCSTSVNRIGRCKRHPHHALIGVCSICLKERLLALALELEEEEDTHVDLGAELYDGARELEYLHGLHAASLEASHAAAEYINNARFSSSKRAPSQLAQLQLQLYHHQLGNPHRHAHNVPPLKYRTHVHGSQPCKKSPTGASGTYRSYKSFTSSPRHSSLQDVQPHEQASARDTVPSTSPPQGCSSVLAARSQPQTLHWRSSSNEVSPISLSGLNHFISSVKATQSNEAEPKKKKKSSSLWSLLQKQRAASPNAEEGENKPIGKSSEECRNRGKSRVPDSISMREVHDSLCRGDASSLLSSPQGVGPYASGYMPSNRVKSAHHAHGSAAQLRRGGHWRSSSCIADDHAFDAFQEDGLTSDVQQGASSPSWLSAIFHKKSRTRSKSISTACNSSPDLNAVMAASASAKYGRFSVDAAAATASCRQHDALKQDARFRKKYACLFEEVTNSKSSKKRNNRGNTAVCLQKAGEEFGCLQCEEVQTRRMKLANFLAAQMNHEGNDAAVYGMINGGAESVRTESVKPVRSSPLASPGRKIAGKEDMPLSSAVYRTSASSEIYGANAQVYSSSPRKVVASPPAGSSAVSNAAGISSDMVPKAAGAVLTSAEGVAQLVDSKNEEKLQHLSKLHNVPRSRSWSKSWNKALSPMLSFKGKAASPSRMKSFMIKDPHLETQLNPDERGADLATVAPRVRSRGEGGDGSDCTRAPQHYSFLSKDYSAFSFYFSPLRRSRRKLAAEAGGGSGGGNMSSSRVNALSDHAAFSGLNSHISTSRHSVDGSCWPSTTHSRHR